MKEVIEKLNEGLKDESYRQSWIANIAMSQLDNERWYREKHNKVGKYLSYEDRHAIANLGANCSYYKLSKNPEKVKEQRERIKIDGLIKKLEAYGYEVIKKQYISSSKAGHLKKY